MTQHDDNKTQVGFFVKPETKVKLQTLAYENNRSMSGQIEQLICDAYIEFLEKSCALST